MNAAQGGKVRLKAESSGAYWARESSSKFELQGLGRHYANKQALSVLL